jgi:hypothetical protein
LRFVIALLLLPSLLLLLLLLPLLLLSPSLQYNVLEKQLGGEQAGASNPENTPHTQDPVISFKLI